MNNPWQILGLDFSTATLKDVKSAYAKLLKLHRPDQDPAGFRRVRDAYEFAMQCVQDRDEVPPPPTLQPEVALPVTPRATSPDERDHKWSTLEQEARARQAQLEARRREGSQPPPPEPPPRATRLPNDLAALKAAAVPADVDEAIERLRLAIAKGGWLRQRWAFFLAQRAFKKHHVPGETRSAMLLQAAEHDIGKLAQIIPHSALLNLLAQKEVVLPNAVISQWIADRKLSLLDALARRLAKDRRPLAYAESALFFLHVASQASLHEPTHGSTLLNRIFPYLTPSERQGAIPPIEQDILGGQSLRQLKPGLRNYWISRLRETQGRLARHPLVLRWMWKRTIVWAPAGWLGWQWVMPVLPEKLAAKTERKVQKDLWWRRQPPIIKAFRPKMLALYAFVVFLIGAGVLSSPQGTFNGNLEANSTTRRPAGATLRERNAYADVIKANQEAEKAKWRSKSKPAVPPPVTRPIDQRVLSLDPPPFYKMPLPPVREPSRQAPAPTTGSQNSQSTQYEQLRNGSLWQGNQGAPTTTLPSASQRGP